jgi:hypothetical protein
MPPRKTNNPYGKAGAYMGLAFVLPVTMVACYFAGDWLGGKWGGIAGIVIGFAAGLYETYRQAMLIEKKMK